MKHEPEMVLLRDLLKAACEESVQREVDAYPTPKELKEKYPDTSEVTKRTFEALGGERKALLRARRRSLHVIRKTLVAAVIVFSVLFATLMTNAEMRAAVVNTLIEWTENFVRIQYEVGGKGPAALPEGYGPHYIPEELVYQDNSPGRSDNKFSYLYRSEDKNTFLQITCTTTQNTSGSSGYLVDSKNIIYNEITFNGVSGQLGTFKGHDGYVMLWVKDSIEHIIYFEGSEASLSEVYRIAENIY